ncbi:MAG: hypothetical protein KG003_13785 [Bacteroidetes bacterium]|nr:hypothetical protein [Bacteroidota bacterium]
MEEKLPIQITFANPFDKSLPTITLKAVGRGQYPYDCQAKRKHPNAMIYMGEHSWEHSEDKYFDKRLKEFDVF